MTLAQAVVYMETLLNQQMSDEAEEAIRTALTELKRKPEKDVVEVVCCHDCKHDLTEMCMMLDEGAVPRVNDYCSYGERK